MKIPFGRVEYPQSSKDLALFCLTRNWATQGDLCERLERIWAELFNYNHSKYVNSGTSALICAYLSLYPWKNAKRGMEVITPALSFISSSTAITFAGFVPHWVETKWDLQIDVDQIERAINKNTIAINPVGLMGNLPELDRIEELATKHNLAVILDGAESYSAKYKGQFGLEYADFETASTFVAHSFGVLEGGFVSSNLPELANFVDSARSHGREPGSKDFKHEIIGGNFKPMDLCAATCLGMIGEFWKIIEHRKSNYYYFRNEYKGLEDVAHFTEESKDVVLAPHAMSIVLKPKYKNKMEDFRKYLGEKGLEVKVNFGAIPDQPCFKWMGQAGKFPTSTYFGKGIHHTLTQYLTTEEKEYMANVVKTYLGKLL